MRHTKVLLAILLFGFVASAHATQLGINYYHESMVGQWGTPYIPRSTTQVGQDLDDIKTMTTYVKLYMNPLVDANFPWLSQVNQIAKSKGLHTVVTMNTEDRLITDSNWAQYFTKVTDACQQLNGKTDEILVGNEIALHTTWTPQTIYSHVVPLIAACASRFNGPVSYEEFYYARDPWLSYPGTIYINMYEHLPSFSSNLQATAPVLGSKLVIGEFGELTNGGPTWPGVGEAWQAQNVLARWQLIKQSNVKTAYLFTYKEPSDNGFGLVYMNGNKKQLWNALLQDLGKSTSTTTSTTPTTTPTPTTTGTGSLAGYSQLSAFATSCTIAGGTCAKTSDSTDSSCRYVTFSTNSGNIQITACSKSTGIEIYRNTYPAGSSFSACFDSSCVNQNTGFQLYGAPSTVTGTVTTPVASPPPSVGSWSIGTLSSSCTASGTTCAVQKDTTAGTCRTVIFTTNQGNVQVQGCDKGAGYVEVYLQQYPQNLGFTVCLDKGCVTKDYGFARFQPSVSAQPVTQPAPVPAPNPTPTTQPLSSGSDVTKLAVTVTPSGTKVSDVMESSGCRHVQFTPSPGWIEARICPKNGHYEMYLLSTPNSASICVGTNCVGQSSGFSSFT